ncbi:hypothetical protein [Streptomyces noursei]|uniref:hypothetical protein n=1 Tax=Streptomyces noursei TaxID=1971 RepID=UPI0023B774D6|nr:hypothetical protein [Streptomyces noursei]
MTPTFLAGVQQRACQALSSPGLIRLITEIDDNGPIPQRALARTLPDLATPHLRQSTDLARALNLVRHRPGSGLDLTTSGVELADLYDALARWARRHSYPTPVCDFTRRIQGTLALLDQVLAVTEGRELRIPTMLSAQARAELAGPRDLLEQWLRAHPQTVQPPTAA